jgi:hypothetical protein
MIFLTVKYVHILAAIVAVGLNLSYAIRPRPSSPASRNEVRSWVRLSG